MGCSPNSKTAVDKAGWFLYGEDNPDDTLEEVEEAFSVVNNWRSSHNFPLNTFQTSLRTKARRLDPNAIVSQRIKRLASIEHKISRFPTMRLSMMQDIGVCRAVVGDVKSVRSLVDAYKRSDIKHKLASEDNYISNPKSSGYRCIHLVYRYYSDKKETYNGLKVEVQLRTALQHAWATAVETVGTFIRQGLWAANRMYIALYLSEDGRISCF